MLGYETLSIEEVAESVGYEDPASFRRIFKRNVGQSSAAYRKKFQHIPQMTIGKYHVWLDNNHLPR
ncbi:MAG: transcriptional regulator GlxA family with amidase domain [Granulosicoccus sp.]|jgi:transcriptional regulator GlxA family with amidase domain